MDGMTGTAVRQDLSTFQPRRWPATLWLGLVVLLAAELLLLADVLGSSRGPIHREADLANLAPPRGLIGEAARFVAANMTPIAWFGYIFLLDGVLTLRRGRSPVRARPHHFALLFLASVSIWCVFDWINFYHIRAWHYIGMPEDFFDRAVGYFVAFGTIVPGMLLSGQLLLDLGLFNWARGPKWRLPWWGAVLSLLVGAGMVVWPLTHADPVTNLTLWTSLVFLLDPINLWLGRPSMWRDWQNGWYGRTLALFAGGLVCGFLWEFWNYWALSKWYYTLPFLGASESMRYFEMPVVGLLGFLPFGLECWVMWQLIRVPLDGLAEPLPDERTLA
jgi:hypothetical protein